MVENIKKILIVEDEKPLARALELKLNNSGYSAKAVFSGEEALNILKTEKFDLILLDLMMPIKDGFAVLKELKERRNTIPIIVSSNLNQVEDIEKAKELGAKDFFTKSDVTLAKIVENIDKFLKTA